MRNFQDYISEAQKKQNLYSLSKIAQKIGISANSVSVMYKNKTLPSEETLIKIADLAGIPREEALLDLSIWSAKSDDAKSTWKKIREMLKTAALVLTFASFYPLPTYQQSCNNAIKEQYTVYYVK
mgnify:CR=1 FL=1